MNSYKKYKVLDETLSDSAKKWVKSEKSLIESIRNYKECFDDPKLVYNKEQINKRYSLCLSNYHNAVKQEINLLEKSNKLFEVKKSFVEYHNNFLIRYNESS